MKAFFAGIGALLGAYRDATRYQNCPHPDEESGGVANDMRDTRTAAHRVHDALFGAPKCTGTYNRCPRCLRRVVPIIFGVILLAGEWITTESGERICRAAVPIYSETTLSPGLCEDWQVRRPQYGEDIAPYSAWLRAKPTGGYQIHTERGWRP